MLDRSSPTPLYYQLALLLQSQIASGALAAGSRLPSERDLSLEHDISRMTVRQAVNYLEHEGLVKTVHGVGTVVHEERFLYDVAKLFGFAERWVFEGEEAQAVILRFERTEPSAALALVMGLERGEQVVQLQRLRTYKQTPLIMETNTFRALQCPGLEAEDPQRSSLTTLRQKYGLLCVRARHGMEAVVADEAQGELLEVPVGSPLLLTEGVTYNGDGQVVECFQVVYRGDRFRFEFSTDGEKAWRLR